MKPISTLILLISLCFLTLPPLCSAMEAQVSRHQIRVTNAPAPATIARRKEYPSLGITEVTLANGLRVLIKATDHDEGEVLFEMFAKGGFAHLDSQKINSGRLSALVAWESGFGGLSGAAIQEVLSYEEIEFKLKTKLACRQIQGTCSEDGLKTVFKLCHLIFTQSKPTEEALQRVLASSEDVYRLRSRNSDQHFEDVIRSVNTGDHNKLRSISPELLRGISLNLIQDFFQQCFGNPADFTLVVVGDCDVSRVLDLAQRYLGNIPASRERFSTPTKIDLPFPHHSIAHKFQHSTEVEDISRITMPLPILMNEDVWCELDALTQAVETRLHRCLREQTGSSLAVDVAYEFPLYPDPSICWMTIQYRSSPADTKQIKLFIISEVERLLIEGPSEEEWDLVKRLLHDNDALWSKENFYWLAMIANYKKWDWPLEGLGERHRRINRLRRETIHKLLKSLLTPQRHTFVTMRDIHAR